jgi:transcriptional antiterminator NusG
MLAESSEADKAASPDKTVQLEALSLGEEEGPGQEVMTETEGEAESGSLGPGGAGDSDQPGPSGEAPVVLAVEDEVVEVTEAEQLDEPEPDDGRAWYVIHCYSGYENKVKHNLEQRIESMQMQDQIFQVVIPTEDEIEVRDGKRRTVERRVFPGYILVQMIQTDDSWYVVRNTPGVTGFVGMGNKPTPLRQEEVQNIMKRMEAEAPRIKVTFKPGQKVRIVEGPFNDFIGVVDEIDMTRAKVRVLVSFFGRETPVELDFLQVEKT